jgi:hypothetical protein
VWTGADRRLCEIEKVVSAASKSGCQYNALVSHTATSHHPDGTGEEFNNMKQCKGAKK